MQTGLLDTHSVTQLAHAFCLFPATLFQLRDYSLGFFFCSFEFICFDSVLKYSLFTGVHTAFHRTPSKSENCSLLFRGQSKNKKKVSVTIRTHCKSPLFFKKKKNTKQNTKEKQFKVWKLVRTSASTQTYLIIVSSYIIAKPHVGLNQLECKWRFIKCTCFIPASSTTQHSTIANKTYAVVW